MATAPSITDPLARYVPRFSSEWADHTSEQWREIDGTVVYVDISGFTALSERLARRGRIGAEELTEVLNIVFTRMLNLAYGRGGSLLKFGGDALLLLFTGDDHPAQACSAAVEMQHALREARSHRTSAGRLRLKMSVGIHSGTVHLFCVGGSHRELLITGPAASMTTRMEETATAGEILISGATRAALPNGSAPRAKGPGYLLPWRTPKIEATGARPRPPVDPESTTVATPVALREFLREGGSEPEHHIATVGFIKYIGTDDLTEADGPAATAKALDQLVTTVQEVVDAEGVTFLASDIDENGGKIIIVAGVPSVQDDDGGRVLRAARQIADKTANGPLDVKIGVNQGHVFAGDIGTEFRSTYTIMGDTVNLAARLMAAAPNGNVYTSAEALASSGTIFATTELEPFHVKGKEHLVQAYAIGAAKGSRPREEGGELPFIGREKELTYLRELAEGIRAGTGSALTIVGDRGVGKSRLLDELRADLRGVLKIEVRAEPYGTATPYRAIRNPVRELLDIQRDDPKRMATLLRRRVGDISPHALPFLPLIGDATGVPIETTPEVELIEPKYRLSRTADVLVDLLVSAFDGAVYFEIEDAHYMDEASAAVMSRIADATAFRPWLVVTTRSQALNDDESSSHHVMELGPLSEDEARELVDVATAATPLRPHDVTEIVRRSAGLPLFLEELLRAVAASGDIGSLPDSLEALVSAQIDSLAPLTRRLLRYASVLGQSFRVETFNELVRPDNIELDAATRRRLREFVETDGPGRIRFRQAMVRDVSYGGLSFRKRRELHQRAAETFARNAAPDEASAADVLSLHFSLANDHAKTWKYAPTAGDRAASSYANVDAAVHYRRALEAVRRLPDVSDVDRARVWSALGDVCERAGLFDESLDAYRRASRLIADDPQYQIELYLKRALVRRRSGSYRAALTELTKAMHVIEDGDDEVDLRARGRIETERASIRRWQQRPAEALRFAEAAERDAREVNDLPTLGKALDLIHWAHIITGDLEHDAPYEETLQIYEEIGDLGRIADVSNNRGADAFYAGRWDEAIAAYVRGSEVARQSGNDVDSAIAQANVAEVLINQRRLDEAEPLLEQSLRVLRASGHSPAIAFVESERARLWLRRGDLEAADASLRDIRQRSSVAGESANVLNTTLLLAEVKLAEGNPGEAEDLIETAERDGGELVAIFGPMIGRLRAQAAADCAAADVAMEHLEAALDQAKAQGVLYEQVLLLITKADVAQRFGLAIDLDEAAETDRLIDELGIRREPASIS